ncbi:hypothetical protein C2G38_2175618 [Gigaspora rosea]|uniref:Uncharacterized protein n=1 Tax=Gigaspora rosea TaxID=44941 RepID=A0A397VH53_9GLOM|nr:hypothetical protein C2G38_2175618 [Gigaspora rosea]
MRSQIGWSLNKKFERGNREADKKYQKPTFRTRKITCEKDIRSATNVNISDALTPLDRPISFLDGRALKNIVGEPVFIIVDDLLMSWKSKTKWVLNMLPKQNIVTLYNEKKEFREGLYTCSNNALVYHPINQIYGYSILSTYNQTWFLERGVTGEDYGWLHVLDAITNTSINPTLLKSIAYIINLASIDHYAPFLEKSIMVADNADKDDDDGDDSFSEKKGDREFKYKGLSVDGHGLLLFNVQNLICSLHLREFPSKIFPYISRKKNDAAIGVTVAIDVTVVIGNRLNGCNRRNGYNSRDKYIDRVM